MKSIWKACAVLGVGAASLGSMGAGAGPGPGQAAATSRGTALVLIQGRLVEVEFALYRQRQGAWSVGRLAAVTRVQTRDPRGLPADLHPLFENVIHQNALIWSTPMQPVPTFAFDPSTSLLASTTQGPDLATGSNAAAVLWMADSRQVYRIYCLTVPVQGTQ